MIIGGGDGIWRLRNKVFESGVVPQDWGSALIIPSYDDEGESTEHYRIIEVIDCLVWLEEYMWGY